MKSRVDHIRNLTCQRVLAVYQRERSGCEKTLDTHVSTAVIEINGVGSHREWTTRQKAVWV